MARKVLFIVNPNSGKRNSEKIIQLIAAHFPKSIPYEIGSWRNIDEFRVLAEKLKQERFTDAVAVGGDGSVNLVASTVMSSDVTLGIIPTGSGNGLARSLGIPVDAVKAIEEIAAAKTTVIDSGTVNGIPFFCTTGVGFDAHIGNLFANLPKRGLQAYIKLIAKEFFSYKAQDYELSINGTTHRKKAFLVTIANAGQYGNDFYIAPQASMTDGKLHVAIMKPFNLLQVLGLTLKIMRMKAHESRFIETFVCESLTVKRAGKGAIHYDGEPGMQGEELSYSIRPATLKVIVGRKFKGL